MAKKWAAEIAAFANGETIQENYKGRDWRDSSDPLFGVDDWKFRIKPKPREFWLCRIGLCACGSAIDEGDGWHPYTSKQADFKNIHVIELPE